MAGSSAGRRRQHKGRRKSILWLLPAELNHVRRLAEEITRGLLAGEGDGAGAKSLHLCSERGNIDRVRRKLTLHAGFGLVEIREADAERQQRAKLARVIAARRYAGLMDCAPEAIARMRIIVADMRRPVAGRSADKDQPQLRAKQVRQLVGRRTHRDAGSSAAARKSEAHGLPTQLG